jgi:hypothetical protein
VPAVAPPPARPATCWPDHCFCEAPRLADGAGPLLQPANALSSLGFAVVAAMVMRRARGAADCGYASALLVVGAASFAYHATLTFATQTADVLGMYLLATWFLVATVARRRGWPSARAALVYGASNLLLLAGLILVPDARRYVFAALILTTVLTATPRERRALVPALVALGASFAIWTFDLLHWWCTPDSLLQGHALWHVGSVVAAWLAWERFAAASDRET